MAEKFSSVKDALKKRKGPVNLRGWVKRKRQVSDNFFILLRDSSGEIQCIFGKKKFSEKEWKQLSSLNFESSVHFTGKLKVDSRAPGGIELRAEKFAAIHIGEPFPIQKDLSEEFLLDVRHLWLRSSKMTAISKVRDSLLHAARLWHRKNNFYETSPAIITPNACEGGTTLFPLDYFGEKRYLSQSAQMYLEALIFSMEKVWALTPSFRAEKHKTARHLSEYWHLEGEIAWGDMFEMMSHIEEMVKFICHFVAKENPKELGLLGRDPKDLLKIKTPFRKISYDDTLKALEKDFRKNISWGVDLTIKEEKLLSQKEKQPFFIHTYPTAIKAFYAKEDPKDGKKCFSFDLIAAEGFGELCTGGQREDVNENLVKKLKKDKIPLKNYEWYLDLRRYGSVPHSGYGLGIERLLQWICKLDSIKDTIPFPRTMNRSYP